MGSCLSRALLLIVQPMRGWAEVGRQPGQPGWAAAISLLACGPIPVLLCRLLGHLSVGWPGLAALLDACWYSTVGLLLLLIAGQGLVWLVPRFGGEGDPTAARRVTFYSSTPLWLSGLLFCVPSLLVQTLAPFLGLLAMGHLLYLGLQQVCRVGPGRAIPLAALVMAGITSLLVLLTQVLPLVVLGWTISEPA